MKELLIVDRNANREANLPASHYCRSVGLFRYLGLLYYRLHVHALHWLETASPEFDAEIDL